MGPQITCCFISADNRRVDHHTPGLSEALEVWESQDWPGQVALAERSTGQFPVLGFTREDGTETYLNISGEEGGRFLLMLEVVVKPGVFRLLGREAASVDVHDASPAQARLFIERFFTSDKQLLCAWVRSMPPSGAC